MKHQKHQWEKRTDHLQQCKECHGVAITHPRDGKTRHVDAHSKALDPDVCHGRSKHPEYMRPRPTPAPPKPAGFGTSARRAIWISAFYGSSAAKPVWLVCRATDDLDVPEEWITGGAASLICWASQNAASESDGGLSIGLGHHGVVHQCHIPWESVIAILHAGTAVTFGETDMPPRRDVGRGEKGGAS